MAELQFPDIGGNTLGAFLQGQQRGKQSKLASLLGTAVSDPSQRTGAINQAAMIDPQAAMSARKSLNDESLADLARDANMFMSLAQSGDQASLGQAYQQIAQKAQQVFGHPFPPAYDPKYLPMIQKLAGSAGGGDDLKSLRIGANGNYWAIRGGQFIDTGTPADPRMQLRDQPGIEPSLVNMRTGGQTPLGGAPQGQQRAPGEVPFSIDPSLPPEVQADIRANEPKYANAQDGSEIGIGGGGGAPAGGGPAAMRPAPVQAPSALQEKIATAQRMGATPDQIKQMVMGTAGKEASIAGDPSDPLGGLSPADAALVQKLAHYQMLPASLGRSNNRAELMARAAMLNPDFNEANAKQAYTYLNDLSKSGPTSAGGQAAAVNTAIHHLGTLMQINAKLKTGQFPLINEATNAYKTATGSSEVTQWRQATNFVAQEVAKLVKGGVANEGEMRDIMRDLNVAGSQEQRNQAISRAAEFLYGRIHAVEERGQRALGEMDPGTSLMTPEAQKLLGAAYKLGGRVTPELLPAQKGGSFTRNSTTPRHAATGDHVDDLLSKYGVK